ncbi:MAG: hypothetical protein AB8H80_17675 [Planctomycetota bacterium]
MANRHRPVSPRSRSRSSLLSRLAVPIGIAALLLIGLAVYTVINGELRLPFGGGVLFAFEKEKPPQQAAVATLPDGTVGVFACPRALPAFTRITREHLLTREGLHTVPVVEQAIEPNGLFRADVDGLKSLLGRVLRRAKPVNFAFTEKDLLPIGTRPGPSAGIPPGRRGMWIDTAKIAGLTDTRAGDLVDLLAAKAMDRAPRADTSVLGNIADPVMKARLDAVVSRGAGAGVDQASSWVVARGAMVITPMRSRELNPGSGVGGKPGETVEEVFLAMAPQEVASFGQALAQGVTMIAAPRSGQPETAVFEIEDSLPVDPNAEIRRLLIGGGDRDGENGGDDNGEGESAPSLGMVEVIQGGQRSTVTVPRAAVRRANKSAAKTAKEKR